MFEQKSENTLAKICVHLNVICFQLANNFQYYFDEFYIKKKTHFEKENIRHLVFVTTRNGLQFYDQNKAQLQKCQILPRYEL